MDFVLGSCQSEVCLMSDPTDSESCTLKYSCSGKCLDKNRVAEHVWKGLYSWHTALNVLLTCIIIFYCFPLKNIVMECLIEGSHGFSFDKFECTLFYIIPLCEDFLSDYSLFHIRSCSLSQGDIFEFNFDFNVFQLSTSQRQRFWILLLCLQDWAFPQRNTEGNLQRLMEFHFLFYSMNDRALLVLQHTVTHDYREVLCRLHSPRGTLKPHPASLTLTKAPKGHWEQTGLHEI